MLPLSCSFDILARNGSSFTGTRTFLPISGVSFLPHTLEKGRNSLKNIELNVEGNKLIIVVDLDQEFGLSSSGKSITVASTEGNVAIPGREEIKIGLNIYKPKPKG